MTLRNIDALFNADRALVLGAAGDDAQRQLLTNLRASLIADDYRQIESHTAFAGLDPEFRADLAIVFDARLATAARIDALADAGCRAVLWNSDAPISSAILRAARPYNLRLLGPRSAGVVQTRSNQNFSTLADHPGTGRVGLITQSHSLTAAALDWALGRRIGFSWLACSGAEADIDVADLLDYAALDPRTRAVVLQVGHIPAPRKFMSAARAAARVKPVLVLQTRRALDDGSRGPDPVRSAAFERAGLVECENLGGLFDGLAALEWLPSVDSERVAVLANGVGACALGTDALLRQGIEPARPSGDSRKRIHRAAPRASDEGIAIDLGRSDTDTICAALEAATADDDIDAVLFIHSPVAGQAHGPMIKALRGRALGGKLMSVWLGLQTALPARRASGQARLATFASADDAVRAVRYRTRYRLTRELLAATPPPDPTVSANIHDLEARLEVLADNGVAWLNSDEAAHLLTAYGLTGQTPAETALGMRVEAFLHAELGMTLRVTDETLGIAPAHGFPPLDTLLARRMLEAASAGRLRGTRAALETLAQTLVRLGRLITDLPHVIGFDLRIAAGPRGRLQAPADPLIEITPQPHADRERLAMSPYPARMQHVVTLKEDARYRVRAIRPADEPAVLDLLDSLSPEEIRLRFFNYIRHFSHDMAARMSQVDYDREVSLVISEYERPSALVALGTLISDPDGIEAEFAILVHHDHTGVGLGRHLLDCLLRQASARDIETVYGEVMSQNTPMLKLARSLGFKSRRSLEDTTSVRVEIPARNYVADHD